MRSLLILGLAMLCACGGSGQPSRAEKSLSERPNVLLVTLDTVRADRFGSYGYDRPTTPNFDDLAARGSLFEFAIGASGCTPPAHASILTGLYPHRHGLRVIFAGSGYRLNPAIPSLATILRDAGYNTSAFLSSFTVSEYFGFDTGFDTWDNGMGKKAESVPHISEERMAWDMKTNQRRSDVTARVASDWLRKQKEAFFCWVHFWDPHDLDLVPPAEWIGDYLRRHSEVTKHNYYDMELAYTDENFGHLITALQESGELQNTYVVVISDHGQGLGDHDWDFHRLLYQEQIQLAFIIAGPGVPVGSRVSDLVRSVDLLPTLVDLMDLEFDPSRLDGASLRGLMNGDRGSPRQAIAEQLNEWDHNSFIVNKRPKDRLLYSVVTEDYKLIYRDNLPDESMLFRLSQDPKELDNLYGKPESADVKNKLLGILDGQGLYRREPFAGETDAEAEERLRALGYLGN